MVRDPKHSQIDRYIPDRLALYLGGFLVLYSRTNYYTGKVKSLLLLIISYGFLGGDLPPLAEMFTLAEWFGIYVAFVVAAMAVEYFGRWPLVIRFNRYHNEDAARSPLRQDTQEILRRLPDPRPSHSDDD